MKVFLKILVSEAKAIDAFASFRYTVFQIPDSMIIVLCAAGKDRGKAS